MSSGMYTDGAVTVPVDTIDALITDLNELRKQPSIRAERVVDNPLTTPDDAAAFLGELAGHHPGDSSGGETGATLNAGAWNLHVYSPEGRDIDGWSEAMAVLARHNAHGAFERRSEYDDEPTRHRIENGAIVEDAAFEVFVGDVVAWIGQMQDPHDTALDHLEQAPTKAAAIAALADAARARHTELAGEVAVDAIPVDGTDEEVLHAWAQAAGVRWALHAVHAR